MTEDEAPMTPAEPMTGEVPAESAGAKGSAKGKILQILLAVAIFLAYSAVLFAPYPRRIEAGAVYLCDLGDSVITLNYEACISAFDGVTEDGELRLLIDGQAAILRTGAEFKRAYAVYSGSELAPMLLLEPNVGRLERAVLFRLFGDRLYADGGDCFCYTGERVELCELKTAQEIVFLGGRWPASQTILTCAKTLHICPDADVDYTTLYRTDVEVTAEMPYFLDGGVLYKELSDGKQLVCGLTQSTELDLDYDYAKWGALMPSTALERLTLPFLGSSILAFGRELGYLFQHDGVYHVPKTLSYVKVKGGDISPTSFYACEGLREIDLCGIAAEDISPTAFAGLDLEWLHCPRADITLRGDYTAKEAPCGCTVFEKVTD